MANVARIEIIADADQFQRVMTAIPGQFQKAERGARGFGGSLGQIFAGNLLADFFAKGLGAATSFFKSAIQQATELQSAMLGLESVATFKGISGADAQAAVRELELVKGGLLSVGEASTALKNLLATGFSLEQSVNLIKRLGDAAAFGRQSALGFGQAVASATEGIKNQNSALVDNAGVTKNLSVILKEAGFDLEDLTDKTKGAEARLALYNGLLQETAAQQGDAARYADTFAGSLAKTEATWDRLLAQAGEAITSNQGVQLALKGVSDELERLANGSYGDSFAWVKDLARSMALVGAGAAEMAAYVKQAIGVIAFSIGSLPRVAEIALGSIKILYLNTIADIMESINSALPERLRPTLGVPDATIVDFRASAGRTRTAINAEGFDQAALRHFAELTAQRDREIAAARRIYEGLIAGPAPKKIVEPKKPEVLTVVIEDKANKVESVTARNKTPVIVDSGFGYFESF
jgi:hypothetical protein